MRFRIEPGDVPTEVAARASGSPLNSFTRSCRRSCSRVFRRRM